VLQQQRAAARARQREAGQQALLALERGRHVLEEGWLANDLAKLEQASAEAERAVDIAGRGEAEPAVRQQADAFRQEVQERLVRARKNAALMAALADISAPRETRRYAPGESGRVMAVAEPSVEEQYAAAFRRWGVDVDRTPEAELVARLQQEPEPVRQEVLAGLDAWMLERRRKKAPEARWRRLVRVGWTAARCGGACGRCCPGGCCHTPGPWQGWRVPWRRRACRGGRWPGWGATGIPTCWSCAAGRSRRRSRC
jgi:hypothetical protein